MVSVPRAFPGSTVVCIGGGPSLTAQDVDLCRDKARVIAINDAYRVAPWADVLYGCDPKWWKWHDGVPGFAGAKWSLDQPNWATLQNRFTDVQLVGNAGLSGLSLDPAEIATGSNSGYQAINLAVLLGATRILLLGYDMQPDGKRMHWFGGHPDRATLPFVVFLSAFKSLAAPLKAAGVEVINCSRQTALTAFPRATLADALQAVAA